MKVEILVKGEKPVRGALSKGIMALLQCERREIPSPVQAVEHGNHVHCIYNIETYERDSTEEELESWKSERDSKLMEFRFEGDEPEDDDEDQED